MSHFTLKKSLFFSLAGHAALISVLGLTFGSRLPALNPSSAAFLGQLLPAKEFHNQFSQVSLAAVRRFPVIPEINSLKAQAPEESRFQQGLYFKPALALGIDTDKQVIVSEHIDRPLLLRERKTPFIMLHPVLPYGFSLYFKDRQLAHVELEFQIVSLGSRSPILIRRRISSGNLEVDLLCERYIGHYLFLRQDGFSPDIWQSVKIDLSEKND